MHLPIRKTSLAGLLLILSFGTAGASEPNPEHQVNDLAYGVSLYHFFQDQYFSAITDLLVAKERNPIEKQGVYPELLLGSLDLSYGLHNEAASIFEPLLAENTPPEVRDRAWFNLGKLRYQRGLLTQAQQDLARIQDSLPDFREAERLNLLANIYLQEQQYDKAIETLKDFSGDSTWEAYARFNLGVALIRQQRFEEGLSQLRADGALKPRTNELAALRDKANLARGYALMKMDRPADAVKAFQEVRLNGPQSSEALLGIGWALSKMGEYDRALTPWLELRDRNPLDPAVQESMLAIPYTFEKTGKPKLALAYYEKATHAYEDKLRDLDNITRAVRDGELLQALRPANMGDETAVSLFRAKLPDSISAPYLKNLMASQEFQEAVKNYQDLIYLDYVLDRWQDSLPTFELMLKERRALYQQKLPEIDKNAALKSIEAFQAEQDSFAREVARIEETNDIFALANDEERDMLEVLGDIQHRLGTLSGQRKLNAQEEKYKLYKGILYWQISSDFVPRLWQLKKGLKEVDQALTDARAAEASLKTAWQQAPKTFEGFQSRISGQQARIDQLKKKVAASRRLQEQQIQTLALDAIRQYRRRLNSYQIRARFALARILDSMNKADTP
jgi:tetratricopeptide (TPR) repeat protein